MPSNGTEVERMVRQRIGQQNFRQALMTYWGGACAVTGIDVSDVLRASHIKPWAECATDAERLDVFNGFLLSANLDALFDKGRSLSLKHLTYLEWHWEYLFVM